MQRSVRRITPALVTTKWSGVVGGCIAGVVCIWIVFCWYGLWRLRKKKRSDDLYGECCGGAVKSSDVDDKPGGGVDKVHRGCTWTTTRVVRFMGA